MRDPQSVGRQQPLSTTHRDAMRPRSGLMRGLSIAIALLASLLAAAAAEEGGIAGRASLRVGALQADDGGIEGLPDGPGEIEATVNRRTSGSGTRYVSAATWWVRWTRRRAIELRLVWLCNGIALITPPPLAAARDAVIIRLAAVPRTRGRAGGPI